jgi:hypothetical protein
MKTLLLTALCVIIIMVMSLTPSQDPYQEYDELIVETKNLTDSAITCLKMLHDHNDSLLDRYFPKDEEYNSRRKINAPAPIRTLAETTPTTRSISLVQSVRGIGQNSTRPTASLAPTAIRTGWIKATPSPARW